MYRTGPGEFQIETKSAGTYQTSHWFDGFAQSHRFTIIPESNRPDAPVRVEYASRRQTEALVEQIRKNGRLEGFSFAQRRDPCVGLFGKVMTVWRMPTPKRNADLENVAVTVQSNVPGLPSQYRPPVQGGHRVAIKNAWHTTDTNTLKEIDLTTLEPIGFATQDKLHPSLKGPLSCAHAQRDPETGDLLNYNLDLGPVPTYRVFRVNAASGTTDILATISGVDAKPAYIHSFFLSASYAILCIPSTHFRAMGMSIVWERNVIDSIEAFDDSRLCKWWIVDRKGDRGVVAKYDSPAGFHFHSVNAFEETDEATGDTTVFCDVIEYPTHDLIRSFEMDVLLQRNDMTKNYWGDEKRNRNSQARLTRHAFRVPVVSSPSPSSSPMMSEKVLQLKAPRIGELPTINPAYATRPYRYVYSLPNRGYSTLLDSIAKTDLHTRETLYWDNPRGHTPGEAVFIARPPGDDDGDGARDEDDGVLLSVVLDGPRRTSYLVCLDAKTMRELGRADCDWAIGMGFHGLHSPPATEPKAAAATAKAAL